MFNRKSGQKKEKLKARLPRGFVDRGGDEIRAMNKMLSIIGGVYEKYGFDPLETPMLEYADCLGKFLPDADRPNEGVFSLNDDDEQWISLRYDLTAPLARHVAANFNEIQMPYRTYRCGWSFRNEKPGPGRFRQFMQMDADSIGSPGVAADAEMCMMMADAMESLGIERGDFIVQINNRKTLDGMIEAFRVPDGKRMTVLRAIDKYDRLGADGVRRLLGAGRKDPSGDIAEGAGLGEGQIANIMALFGIEERGEERMSGPERAGGIDSVRQYENARADDILTGMADRLSESPIGLDGVAELRQIWEIISSCGYDDGRVRVEPSIVRGLEYYTGPVYEATLTFPVTNEKGEEVVFGSVGGGGRYDDLVRRFTGQIVPATGFSIGASRLMTALKNLGKLQASDIVPPVLVTVMDGNRMSDYQKMAQALRDAGIRAETYQGNWKKFGNQLKYADRRGCPLAIIQGEDERAAGEIQIKDLVEGKRLSETIGDNATWRESRPAQVKVREGAMIDEARRMLREHAKDGAGTLQGKAKTGFAPGIAKN